MASSSVVHYGEMYLRRLHQQGFPPTYRDRMEFNRGFYRQGRGRIPDRHMAVHAVSQLYQSIKIYSMPIWIKRQPALHRLFLEVLADYQRKYDRNAIPIPNVAIQKKARPVEAIKNDENMEVMAASLLQLPDEAPTDHEKKQTEKAIPIFKCKIEPKIEEEEDVAVLERKKPRKGSKNARKIQFEGEKTEAIPGQNAVQATDPGQKNVAIKPTHLEPAPLTNNQSLWEDDQKRIQQLETEAAEKEEMFLEWKRKNEDEKKKAAERMARLEEELKAAQHQLATKDGMLRQLAGKAQVLTEKMELKDIIIRDKERTIEILSSHRS